MADFPNKADQDGGLEDAPHMVPGDVVNAESFDNSARKKSQTPKLLFAVALLLFAGGWGYKNQQEFKAAFGMQEDKKYPGCVAGGSCCSHAVAARENSQPGACCHETKMAERQAAAAAEGQCCANSQSAAMAAALLKGTEDVASLTEKNLEGEAETDEQKEEAAKPLVEQPEEDSVEDDSAENSELTSASVE